ncbi:RING-H2 finger protein ATL8 [Rhynchospora pubera]|uniref:RING-H2 finger protein ATL8 n=1 Tax=Rhynchospora pubera TaxID=906938 RepID=A0AAV8GR70_9POAL|nr:RING-H2 finger protein ATL8 [Rhynchospora pubera]
MAYQEATQRVRGLVNTSSSAGGKVYYTRRDIVIPGYIVVLGLVAIWGSIAILFLICWVCRIIRSNRAGHNVDPEIELQIAPPLHVAPTDGLEHTTIESLPVVAFPPSPRWPDDVQDPSCTWCLEDIATGMDIRVLPCRHYFHPTCIDPYLLVRASCPTCRRVVAPA